MVSCGRVMARRVGAIIFSLLWLEKLLDTIATQLPAWPKHAAIFMKFFPTPLFCSSSIQISDWFNSNLKLGSSVPCHVAVIFRWTVMLCCFRWSRAGSAGPLCVKISQPNGKFFLILVFPQIFRRPYTSSAGRWFRETSSWIWSSMCLET